MRSLGLISLLLIFPLLKACHQHHERTTTSSTFDEQALYRRMGHLNIGITDPPGIQAKASGHNPGDLKQSDWYSEAMKHIEDLEYEIHYQDQDQCYSSPNRRQNLRAFYGADRFVLAPRNDSADKWKLELTTLGLYTGRQQISAPDRNARVEHGGKKIRFISESGLTTEFVNGPEGVRQNFIIEKEPATKPQTLNLRLKTSRGWFVNRVSDKELHFAKATRSGYDKKLTYNGLKVWDANNRELNAGFSVRNDIISIEVDTKGAIYPITIDPISTTPAAILEINQANAAMGISVSNTGDVNGDGYGDVIVGAQQYSNGEFWEGAAFVFHGSANGISTTPASIIESNKVYALMGTSVSGAGDVNGDGFNDIIVGAYQYTNGQNYEGAAFIYHGSATGINTTATAILESNQVNAAMGFSVSGAGDVNSDGYSDVIVGAKRYSNGQNVEGVAFVYHGSASGINSTAAVMLENDQAGAYMGSSVSGAGDLNGDGYSDVIVGATHYDNGHTEEGAAFVYHGSATGINTTVATRLESDQADAQMGNSVSGAGDVNGDGFSDVIVGARYYTNGQSLEGAAFVYQGSATGISTAAAVRIESDQAGAFMGTSVSSAGDVNGDGYSDMILGAVNYDNGQNNEGAAFVYHGSASGISPTATAILESNQAEAGMGWAVSSSGDVNGDGYSDIIVGAWSYDNGQENEGAAFVYHGSASTISTTAAAMVESNQQSAKLGSSVAGAGDVNGDGYSDVIVGAMGYDNGQADEGAAFVYHGAAFGISTTAATILESNQAGSVMGFSVSEAGDVNGDGYGDIIVGAEYYSNGQTKEGAAFVYHGSATGISTAPAAIVESDRANASMGRSVSGAGDVNGDGYGDVIVGAYNFFNSEGGGGAAFVYHGSATGISTIAVAMVRDDQCCAMIGGAVSGAGDVNGDGYGDVIVGAEYYSNGQTDEGAAFVYHGSATGISTTAAARVESDQASAIMGGSVSGAGDVNHDGYGDVIVGAYGYRNSQIGEGAAFVYHGSASGISTTAATKVVSNQALAMMGISVSGVGDVNGDGYSDVIVGAYLYDNGQTNEGAAFLYHGSSNGISSIAAAMVESNRSTALIGASVSGAGDVNGDGYSDVIVGASGYDNGQADEGAAFVYYGNGATGIRNNLRLYNTDLITPIQKTNIDNPTLFGAGLFVKSPFGRVKGRLVWEVMGQGQAFSGNPITNSIAYFDRQTSFTDLGLTGTELKNQVQKRDRHTKIRARVEYSKTTSLNGQVYGPWRYPAGYTMGMFGMDAGALPLTLLSFGGQFVNAEDVELKWVTTNELDVRLFTVERSMNGTKFIAIGETAAKASNGARAEYSYVDKTVKDNLYYYRLKITELNGSSYYSKTIILKRKTPFRLSIVPNPVISGDAARLVIQGPANNRITVNLVNALGQTLSVSSHSLQAGINEISLDSRKLAPGMYHVRITGTGMDETRTLVIQ